MKIEKICEIGNNKKTYIINKVEFSELYYVYTEIDGIDVVFYSNLNELYPIPKDDEMYLTLMPSEVEKCSRKVSKFDAIDYANKFIQDEKFINILRNKVNFKLIYEERFINLLEIFNRVNRLISKKYNNNKEEYYELKLRAYKLIESILIIDNMKVL
jgi:hypothetical protein